jgi:enoyl-CoA hydratase/carnithine racemase
MKRQERMILRQQGHVAEVTINHPPANSIDLSTAREFARTVEQLEADNHVRVVIITGGGDKCFSAGLDVRDAGNAAAIGDIVRPLWTRLDSFPKPVIAALNGHALGGGLELALCCHFRVAAQIPGLKIGLTELNLGIMPGWGGTQRLSRLVGRPQALEMILLSKVLTPEQALQCGLVDAVVPQDSLLSHAMEMAERLADRPPLAVRWVLKAVAAKEYLGLEQGLAVEKQGAIFLRGTRDREEGMSAFLEKRKPVFKGE